MPRKSVRYTLQLNLTDPTQVWIEELHQRTGMPKRQIAQRFFDWLSQQEEDLQLSILGIYSEEKKREAMIRMLERETGLSPPSTRGRVAS